MRDLAELGFTDGEGVRESSIIDPGHFGCGAGRQLLTGTFTELRKRGFRSCVIWAHAKNTARFFYEAMGGRLVAERTARMMGDAVPEVAAGCEERLALTERKKRRARSTKGRLEAYDAAFVAAVER